MGQQLLDLRKCQPEDVIVLTFLDEKIRKEAHLVIGLEETPQPGKTFMLMEFPKEDHRVAKICIKKTQFDTTSLPCHLITGGQLIFWKIPTITEDGSASILRELKIECFYVIRNPFAVRQIMARYNLSDIGERGSLLAKLG